MASPTGEGGGIREFQCIRDEQGIRESADACYGSAGVVGIVSLYFISGLQSSSDGVRESYRV